MNDTFTFEEFRDSMTEEEVKGWHYEGISITELYHEYLLSLDPPCNYRPEWAYQENDMNQIQMFYTEHKKIAECNELFLELAKDMTKSELQKLIEKRPSLWGKYSNWLNVLPD